MPHQGPTFYRSLWFLAAADDRVLEYSPRTTRSEYWNTRHGLRCLSIGILAAARDYADPGRCQHDPPRAQASRPVQPAVLLFNPCWPPHPVRATPRWPALEFLDTSTEFPCAEPATRGAGRFLLVIPDATSRPSRYNVPVPVRATAT
jgi:hypothetical protein